MFGRMLVLNCLIKCLFSDVWSNVFLRFIMFSQMLLFEDGQMFVFVYLVVGTNTWFHPSFQFSFYTYLYILRCHTRWDHPHGPSSNSDPSSLLVGHTVQVTTQYTHTVGNTLQVTTRYILHSWPHSAGYHTVHITQLATQYR